MQLCCGCICSVTLVSLLCRALPRLTSAPDCVFPDEEKHPAVQEGETVTDYQKRTEQYWIGLARANTGSDAKDKKVAKVALAMAKVFYEDQ